MLASPALADPIVQARRLDDTVRVGGLTSLLEPLPVPVAAQAQDDPAICGQVTADDFRLCRGLVDNNCGVVPADRYWLYEGGARGLQRGRGRERPHVPGPAGGDPAAELVAGLRTPLTGSATWSP